jgi:hypothetical protein
VALSLSRTIPFKLFYQAEKSEQNKKITAHCSRKEPDLKKNACIATGCPALLLHPESGRCQELSNPWFGQRVRVRPLPLCFLPDPPEPRIPGMESQRSGNIAERVSFFIGNPEHNAPVKFALGRAVAVDCASDEITVRTQEPARVGVLLRKRNITEDLPLIFIDNSSERGAGRDRFASEFIGTALFFDNNIVTEIHAARPALTAGEGHVFPFSSGSYRTFAAAIFATSFRVS